MHNFQYRRSNKSTFSHTPRNRFAGRGKPPTGINQDKYVKKAAIKKEEVAFVPKIHFADLPIDSRLKNNILKRGYNIPTPIQDGTILHILEGKDIIGIANTGTGKTAAFLIPLIEKILKDKTQRILIIVPTRELGQQIQEEFRSFTPGLSLFSTLLIGGASIGNQMYELRRNPHVVIGTPGRLKDMIKRNMLRMDTFHSIVLDEVDRMVDMGFIQDIKYLTSLLPVEKQSLFFSATIPDALRSIIQSFLKNPVTISVRTHDTSDHVDQDIVKVQGGENKMNILENLLKQSEFKKVLIFGRTKRGVERLYRDLQTKGFKVASIHGDITQFKRQQAIHMFKKDIVSILVATDVAARGIDVPNVTHVINYDEPATYEDYIHRIGRTGRANQTGKALTFV